MLYEVIKKAREAKIGGIFVETNGTLVSNEDVDFFKKYEVVIGVSLDGAVKESHDYIRGAGNFEKTICTIKKLVDERIKVRISATLMKSNLKDVEKIIYLAKDLGADSTSFNVVKKIGKAEAHTELLLSPEEAYSAVSTVWKTAKEVGVPTYLEDRFKMLEELTRADMCGVGTALLAVSSDGDVYPCNMLFEFEEFKAGNIREQHLEEIWRKSEAAKIFTNLSVLDIEGCGNCELKFICAICPVEIYKEYGSFNKKPSFCSFYKGTCWILIEELARKMWSEQ
jgi:radical SAM protein with 4Fe4S-binding SPASM domain